MQTLPMLPAPSAHARASGAPLLRGWAVARFAGVLAVFGLALIAFLAPALGLAVFWHVCIMLAPLLFLVAPGLWRNVCPMATLNVLPSRLGWSRGLRLSGRAQRLAPIFSALLFIAIVPLRKVLLEQEGGALAAFLLIVLGSAFACGLVFGNKGGWCGHLCPLSQVERFYGHSPLLVVRDTHCPQCTGCARHCYDLNPTRAHLAELYGDDRTARLTRLAFAGAMPWLVVAFFTQPPLLHPTVLSLLALYARILAMVGAGAVLCVSLAWWGRISHLRLVRMHALAALNLYYLCALPAILPATGHLRFAAMGMAMLCMFWLWAAIVRERVFVAHRILTNTRMRRGATAPHQ